MTPVIGLNVDTSLRRTRTKVAVSTPSLTIFIRCPINDLITRGREQTDQRNAARGKVGPAAKTTIAAVRDFAERAAALLDAPQVLRDKARHKSEILNGDSVAGRLRATPLEALKQVGGRGVRYGALEQAGYRTVAEVLDAPDHRLLQVPGVGQTTVVEVRRAARAIAVQVHWTSGSASIRTAATPHRHSSSPPSPRCEFARKSADKDADRRAVDTSDHRSDVLDDESVSVERRVLPAKRHRLGLDG
jgi:hypothetical protein